MKTLLSLAVMAACVMLVHIGPVEGIEYATKQGVKSFESGVVPTYLGIFVFDSGDQSVNPPINTHDAIPPTTSVVPAIPNATLITPDSASIKNTTADWLAQLDPFTPQNAYTAFVSQVNQTVQDIFWGQFNYTEQMTNEGLAAMKQVQQSGGNADEARKAFIQNASTTRSDIVTVNKNLNIQYGHANSTVQDQFDKYGNLR
ncbi:MAG: hypothetical protein KGI27_02370 [Thaumarchaeota archaeon]|nr:hypothetical protein [Nitrososphaerota archaeon]